MKNGLLIDIYQLTSKVLLNRFSLFISSPYYNKQKTIVKLHQYLLAQHPIYIETKCTKENIFYQVFGEVKFSNQKLKDASSSLLELYEQFLVCEALKKDKANFRRLEIQECIDNKLHRLSKKVINSSFKEAKNLTINQSKQFYHNYILHDLAYTFQVYNGDRKTSAVHLQKNIDNLDKFYFTEKMLIGSAIVNRQKILNTDFCFNFFEDINKIISQNSIFFDSNKIIKLNQALYLLQKTDNEQNYSDIKNLIQETKLNQSELRVYFSFLTNFCIRMINSGRQKYLRELFLLNKGIIKNKLLLENGTISEWAYKNTIVIALRIKEFEWAENFIEKYSKNLNSKTYLNAYNYNLADVSYSKKAYDKAMSYLIDVEYTDVFYLLSSKALLLKIYYETNEFEVLDSLLHSFRLLVMRQTKISKKQKDAYLNLIKTCLQLLKIQYKKELNSFNKAEALEKIDKKLNKMNAVANKTWLIEKIKELV